MYDGSTALILAARLAVEGMVEELITCHADVNAVDELGELDVFWGRYADVPAVRRVAVYAWDRALRVRPLF